MDKDCIALGNGAAIDDSETRMAQHDCADPERICVNWHGRGPGVTRAENLSRPHGKHLRHSHLFRPETVVLVKNRTGEANNDHAGTDAYEYWPANSLDPPNAKGHSAPSLNEVFSSASGTTDDISFGSGILLGTRRI